MMTVREIDGARYVEGNGQILFRVKPEYDVMIDPCGGVWTLRSGPPTCATRVLPDGRLESVWFMPTPARLAIRRCARILGRVGLAAAVFVVVLAYCRAVASTTIVMTTS